MRNLKRKIICLTLVLCLLVSSIAVGSFAVNAAKEEESAPVAATGSQGAQDKIQGAAVLHCFNWSYNNIKSNLKAIADAGYTAVQTSPVQPPKDYNSGWTDMDGQWWKMYQPIGISIADGNTWLGRKSELKALCTEADKYGIKVIVDIVVNHMADNGQKKNGLSNVSSQVESAIRSNSNYWHLEDIHADNDNDRYRMTHGAIDLPDLNTGNSYIQNRVKSLLTECINLGVDGFRFDAAKHIELPTDPKGASNFWPTVINGSKGSRTDLYYYGEILNYQGTAIENYTDYMSVTDHYSGEQVLYAANKNNVTRMADTRYYKDGAADKSVLWCESHDTYMGNETKNVSDASIIKGWAIVASRADATALFLARPNSTMGAASSNTTWKSKAVAEVNKFKNFFDGEDEMVSAENGCAYNERGSGGVVISRPAGGGSVSLTAHKMLDGSYKDHVTGNTFTVQNGKITGTVGSTGVAVVYNLTAPKPSASVTPGNYTYRDTLTLTLKYTNATSGQYSIDGGSYQNYTSGQTITIGSNVVSGGVTTVKVKATDGTNTSQEVTYTYTKRDFSIQRVYFDNSSYKWSSVYAYIYNPGGGEYAAWPGTKMTLDSSTGYYALDIPESFETGKVIFTESETATTNRYPADKVEGMDLESESKLFKANHQFVDYTPVTPTTPQPTTNPDDQKVLIGDTNGDGIITVLDATLIQRHAAAFITLTGNSLKAADASLDGVVSVYDATAVQRYSGEFDYGTESCGKYL